MNTKDSYRNYSPGDIQKYLAGELSAAEMHALESAALEDPFLADALEGIETDRGVRGANALPADMEELKKRLAARVAEKRKSAIPLYRSWWRVAAAVVLLTGLAVFSSRYFFTGQHGSPELAKSEKQAAPAGGPVISAKPAAAPANADTVGISPRVQESLVASSSRSTIKQDKARAVTEFKTDKPDDAFENAEINRKKLIRAYYFGRTLTDTMRLAFPTRRYTFDSSRNSFAPADKKLLNGQPMGFASNSVLGSNHYFVGKVIDSNNNPIPFATISFFNKQQVARTDNNGVFQFQLLGSPDSSTPVMISSVGYFPVSLTLNALTRDNDALSNIIRMQPVENALNEVVTIGYGPGKRKALAAPADFNKENRASRNAVAANAFDNNAASNNPAKDEDLAQRAAPVIGWVAYQDYLKKYKPSHNIDSTLNGNEIISFQVDRKGKLSSFKIEQSLSPAHDSLLIRLIKKGPIWKPLEGKKAGAIVIMAF